MIRILFIFNYQDVDLIFTKAKNYKSPNPQIVRKLSFSAFKRALFLLAQNFSMPTDQLVNYVLYSAASGPVIKATVAESNKFYDDPSTYTGIGAV